LQVSAQSLLVICGFPLSAHVVAGFRAGHGFRSTLLRFRSLNPVQSTTIEAPVLVPENVQPSTATCAVELPAGFSVHPRRFRKATKQVATLGPSCMTLEMIEKLFLSGADVFRLNFSHGEHHEKEQLMKLIRQIERKYNHPIAILADLQVHYLFYFHELAAA
jgi:hypothetical protein